MKFAHDEADIDIRRTLTCRQEAEPYPTIVRFDLLGLQEVQVLIPEIHDIGFDQTAIDPEDVFRKARFIDPLDKIEADAVPFVVHAATGGPVPERLPGNYVSPTSPADASDRP